MKIWLWNVAKCLSNKLNDVKYKPSEELFEDEVLPIDFVDVLEDVKINGSIDYNDYISAKLGEIKFQFANVEMTSEYRNKDDSYYGEYTTFKGNKKMAY